MKKFLLILIVVLIAGCGNKSRDENGSFYEHKIQLLTEANDCLLNRLEIFKLDSTDFLYLYSKEVNIKSQQIVTDLENGSDITSAISELIKDFNGLKLMKDEIDLDQYLEFLTDDKIPVTQKIYEVFSIENLMLSKIESSQVDLKFVFDYVRAVVIKDPNSNNNGLVKYNIYLNGENESFSYKGIIGNDSMKFSKDEFGVTNFYYNSEGKINDTVHGEVFLPMRSSNLIFPLPFKFVVRQ